MHDPTGQLVPVDGAQLEIEDHGSGDVVVLIQTALMADELIPLAHRPEWLPQTEDVVIAGADHSLATTHSAAVAGVLARFWEQHPIPG